MLDDVDQEGLRVRRPLRNELRDFPVSPLHLHLLVCGVREDETDGVGVPFTNRLQEFEGGPIRKRILRDNTRDCVEYCLRRFDGWDAGDAEPSVPERLDGRRPVG